MTSSEKMEVFWAKYDRVIRAKCIEDPSGHGCLMWVGKKKGGYGMQVVAWPWGKRSEVNVARLMLMIKLNTVLQPTDGDSSHLCHRKECCNPLHITLESHEINMERRHCVSQGFCTKSHTPYCLL